MLTVLRSEISGNDGCSQGSAIHNVGSGTRAEITDSMVSGNTSTGCGNIGAIHTDTFGMLTISGSTVSGNEDPGVTASQSASASIDSTTVSGNGGAGIVSLLNGIYDIVNSTISGNEGAGISVSVDGGRVSIEWSTVTANGGGGIVAKRTPTAKASIVAGNTGDDCTSLSSEGYMLLGNSVGCTFTQAAGDLVNVGPELGPLQNNSAPQTHALLPGSPAIDAVPQADCSITTDERGVARPQGPACDIGAFEARPEPTVGLVDPDQGRWHLRNAAGQVTSFFFGNPGDFPILGDWDCDGTDTPGMYRQSDGFVYLSNANRSQVADIRFFFGNPGDVPLAGDFNGDGCDTVSIYPPGTSPSSATSTATTWTRWACIGSRPAWSTSARPTPRGSQTPSSYSVIRATASSPATGAWWTASTPRPSSVLRRPRSSSGTPTLRASPTRNSNSAAPIGCRWPATSASTDRSPPKRSPRQRVVCPLLARLLELVEGNGRPVTIGERLHLVPALDGDKATYPLVRTVRLRERHAETALTAYGQAASRTAEAHDLARISDVAPEADEATAAEAEITRDLDSDPHPVSTPSARPLLAAGGQRRSLEAPVATWRISGIVNDEGPWEKWWKRFGKPFLDSPELRRRDVRASPLHACDPSAKHQPDRQRPNRRPKLLQMRA
jgi:hypothetical protein